MMKQYQEVEEDFSFWSSEVRDYEIDFQGIVNNAHYLEYLEHARNLYLKKINTDVVKFAEKNINIVLVETHLKYKRSLKSGDRFTVHTHVSKPSKVRYLFKQAIFLEGTKTLILEAESTLCCVDSVTGKVCVPTELEALEAPKA